MRVNESVARLCRLSFLLFITAFIIDCLCRSTGIQAEKAIHENLYYIRQFVGSGGSATELKLDVPALEAQIGAPSGIVQSSNGDLYFASRLTHSVLKVAFNKVDGTSVVTRIAGTGSMGKGDDDVPATESALNSPYAVAVVEDANGEVTAVLIADTYNDRIRKLDVSDGNIKTIAGGGDQTGDGVAATIAQVLTPYHVYYEKTSRDIFITSFSGNSIKRVLGIDGTISTVVGKCPVQGELGDEGLAADACLKEPRFFTMNSAGEWFIADGLNNRIRKVDKRRNIHTFVGGGDKEGDGFVVEVKLSGPVSLSFAPSGEMLIMDKYGDRMVVVDTQGYVRVLAGSGQTTVTSEGIPLTSAAIRAPTLAYTDHGILMCDNKGYIYQLFVKCFGVPSVSDAVCSGHGTCLATDECQCDDGGEWMGVDCSLTHCFGITSNLASVCSGNGECVNHNECSCSGGFRGHRCQRLPRSSG